jgi:hypothetical protein
MDEKSGNLNVFNWNIVVVRLCPGRQSSVVLAVVMR